MSIETSMTAQMTAEIQVERRAASVAETQLWGRALGALLRSHIENHSDGDAGALIIALHGDLGAGKTTLTQGIAAGMGVRAHVTSPTFTLINEYEARDGVRLFHVDGYRLGDAAVEAGLEAAAMGLDELLTAEGVVVIEWAERIADLLPADHIEIYLSYVEEPIAQQQKLTAQDVAPDSQPRHILCRAAGSPASAPRSTRLVRALDAGPA